MIELQRATKLYGSVIGVNDISVRMEPGAYGLLGPNGSGKTTLLNLITGQLRPTLGAVHTLGADPWNNEDVVRQIGLCPATDVPYTGATALEWVSHLMELSGFDRPAADRVARDALEQVGLGAEMQRRMGTYSRGMRQRAKLAQAFAHDPQLLILDEPFNGLDPVGRHEMTDWLKGWIRRGRSLLLASHVLHEVEAVSDSFLLICGGRLLASGTAAEVRSLLADLPHEIRIVCDRPSSLARRILERGAADGLRFEDEGKTLVIATRNPMEVYNELPHWIGSDELRVRELRSPDESLQMLFDSLLRIHRGKPV